jgi:uncharacterized membrane protein YfcA
LGDFLFFLIIAFVYSSVGFGGGSSYLAVLAMYNLPYQEIRLTALICNVIVVVGGVYIYIKNKQVDWKKVLPITLVSVPMAYLGAVLKISQETFFLILGITLSSQPYYYGSKQIRKTNRNYHRNHVCSIGK